MSHPCCMKAPSENHRLLKMVKLFVTAGPSVLSSTFHSSGLNRLTRNRTTLTPSSVPLSRSRGTWRSRSRDDADADVGENDAHPDLVGQRLHEGHDARDVLLRLLEHDADAEAHERLAKVDDSLASRRDGQRRQRQVCFLHANTTHVGPKLRSIRSYVPFVWLLAHSSSVLFRTHLLTVFSSRAQNSDATWRLRTIQTHHRLTIFEEIVHLYDVIEK